MSLQHQSSGQFAGSVSVSFYTICVESQLSKPACMPGNKLMMKELCSCSGPFLIGHYVGILPEDFTKIALIPL